MNPWIPSPLRNANAGCSHPSGSGWMKPTRNNKTTPYDGGANKNAGAVCERVFFGSARGDWWYQACLLLGFVYSIIGFSITAGSFWTYVLTYQHMLRLTREMMRVPWNVHSLFGNSSSRYEAVNIPSVARQPIAPKRTPPLIEVLISHWLTLIRPAIKPLFLQGGGMLGEVGGLAKGYVMFILLRDSNVNLHYPTKSNISPKKGPVQKEMSFSKHWFQRMCEFEGE